jgi:hypothetical protein
MQIECRWEAFGGVKPMFRKAVLFAAVLLSLAALAGCSTPSDAATTAPTAPPASEPAETEMIIQVPTPAPTASPTAAATLTSDEDLSQKEYMLRQLPPDFEKWFERPYPDEITGLADADLQGFRCTNSYFDISPYGDPQLGYIDGVTNEKRFLTDTALTAIVNELNRTAQETKHHVSGLVYCEIEDGTEIVLYSLAPCDPPRGACPGDPYVGVLDSGLITPIAAPRDLNIAYVSCRTLLAVDKANNLYYRCSGGDGGGSGTVIFKINLISKEQTTLVDCDLDGRVITCK